MTDSAQELTNVGALRAALDAAAYSVRQAWKHARTLLVRVLLANLIVALTPPAQVLAVSWLVRSSAGNARDFLLPLVTLTALVGVGQVMEESMNLVRQRVRLWMRQHYQNEMMRTVAALPPQRLAESQTTALIQGCRSSLLELGELAASVVASAAAVVTAAALCVTVWMISPIAGVLVIAALVPSLLVFAWEAKLQDVVFLRSGHWERRSNYAVEQLVSQRTATELATLGSGKVVAEIADGHRSRADALMHHLFARMIRADTMGGAGTAILLGGALAGIMLRGAGGAGIAAGIVAVLSGLQATRAAGFSFGDVISFAPKVKAYRRLVDTGSRNALVGGGVTIRRDAATVQATGLGVTYPDTPSAAISGVSLYARKGEMIALVGVNGAGKTTTVNAVRGHLDTHTGTVTIDGTDAGMLPIDERLGYFGLLTQEFGRYEFPVRDVVRIGRPDGQATDDEIWQALECAHAQDVVRAMPHGLDTQLGPQFGGVGLSGGQWQRLALARIYLRNAPIWILDEPTSAIDAEAEQQIFAELRRTKSERITIVVSHRAWTLKGMDRIYVFDHGRVIEDGTYDQLLCHNGRFAGIFAEQVA